MKKIFIIMIFLVLGSVSAQDFTGIKIYINPGHGGHDAANDRYIAATGFWESDGNLTKGLHLRALLENAGATVFMSRTQNRDVDDLPLSQISADANANNVDYFHAIHSNAANATVNYPLLLFRGYDNDPVFPDAKAMGSIMWYHLKEPDNQWIDWPYSWSPNNRGDWSFYDWGTSGLGVLRGLVMPGTLSEGTFHDYIPNAWRLMSLAYREYESLLIFRAFVEFYQLDKPQYGAIAGIVRDKSQNVTYSYSVNLGLPNDKYLTVDNSRVRLVGEDRSFLVDFNKNGFYLFDSVAAGDYQLIFESGDYDADTLNATVVANKTSFVNAYLNKVSGKAPEVYSTSPAEQDTDVSTYLPLTFAFSQKMNKSSVEQAFKIVPESAGIFKWSGNFAFTFYQNDAFELATNYQVVIDTGALSLNNIKMAEPYILNFTTAAAHVYPQISAYYPDAETDSADIYADIMIRFDTEMRTPPTEAAFHISPDIEGSFSWNTGKSELTFVPAGELSRYTQYTVTLDQDVQNLYGVGLEEPFTFQFWTRQRNEIGLVRSYPASDAQEICPKLIFAIEFNSPVGLPVFASYIELKSQEGMVSRLKNFVVKDNLLRFQPSKELELGKNYILTIKPDIKDIYGLPLQDTVRIEFATAAESFAGSVLEDFEFQGEWQNPVNNDSSKGIDQTANFSLSTAEKISGSYSGLLLYKFSSDSGGVYWLLNQTMFVTANNPESVFAIWVYGDFSGNALEFWFDRNGTNQVYMAGTIDWLGWKMIKFPLSVLAGSGLPAFHSIVVRQITGASTESTLYVDDVQIDVVSRLEQISAGESLSRSYQLYQNYPNPFNPSTTIRYQIAQRDRVNITVFNILGQQIVTLVDEVQSGGDYQVTWNAGSFPSGIYYYKISTPAFHETKKLLLIK